MTLNTQHPTDVGRRLSDTAVGGGGAENPGEQEKETAAAKKAAGCSDIQDPMDAPLPVRTETEHGEEPRSSSSASRNADSFVDEEGGVSSSGILKKEALPPPVPTTR